MTVRKNSLNTYWISGLLQFSWPGPQGKLNDEGRPYCLKDMSRGRVFTMLYHARLQCWPLLAYSQWFLFLICRGLCFIESKYRAIYYHVTSYIPSSPDSVHSCRFYLWSWGSHRALSSIPGARSLKEPATDRGSKCISLCSRSSWLFRVQSRKKVGLMEPEDKLQAPRTELTPSLCSPPAPDGAPQTSDPSVKGLVSTSPGGLWLFLTDFLDSDGTGL